MSNQVFANNMEVSCKQAAGKSICAFPDVCFTPPLTPATPPGVPIPYPNTGMASDTTSGSTSVKISGQEVMLKNKSYFKRSMGDEAGCAPKKGVVTSKNMGKVYFTMWSMDVKVEGENVVRMLDLTTHNHASLPGNTPTWPYLDEAAFAEDSTDPCNSVAKGLKDNDCQKHVKANTYSTDSINASGAAKAICDDKPCRDAMKCVLSPYDPSNCCNDGEDASGPKKTPHHIVPKHCIQLPGEGNSTSPEVYPGCDNYNSKLAPCICVSGHDKSTGDHKAIHDMFDPLEDSNMVGGKASTWTYEQASYTGSAVVAEVTKCPEACIRKQVDAFHQQSQPGRPNIKNETKLLAKSSGVKKADNFTTVPHGLPPT